MRVALITAACGLGVIIICLSFWQFINLFAILSGDKGFIGNVISFDVYQIWNTIIGVLNLAGYFILLIACFIGISSIKNK